MRRPDVLVSTQWAENNLATPGIVFVEVDEDTTACDGGHIPGAVKQLRTFDRESLLSI
jgi:thiosulfate/3-mercaptopyruvate sulfurtransferase